MKEFCEGHQRQNFKAPKGEKKSIPYDLWFKGYAFFLRIRIKPLMPTKILQCFFLQDLYLAVMTLRKNKYFFILIFFLLLLLLMLFSRCNIPTFAPDPKSSAQDWAPLTISLFNGCFLVLDQTERRQRGEEGLLRMKQQLDTYERWEQNVSCK